jgi:Ca2+-binding RTX toxin-like protein
MSVEQTFFVKAQNGKYLIDGDVAPNLELVSGKTYEFNLFDPSLSSHPLEFKLNGNSWDDGVQYSGTLGIDQKVTLTVPSISDGIVSYYCSNHSGMGNDLSITWNYITGTVGDDELYGGDGDDNLQGGSGSDTLHGGSGDDRLYGNYGSDGTTPGTNPEYLSADNDEINGGAGNDYVEISHGSDTVDGGEGQDSAGFGPVADALGGGVKVNFSNVLQESLGPNTYILNDGTSSSISSIEAIALSNFDDVLYNDENGNSFLRGGNDRAEFYTGHYVVPGSGSDTIVAHVDGVQVAYNDDGNDLAGNATQGIRVTYENGVAIVIDSWGDRDILTGVNELLGSHLNDQFSGNDDVQLFHGGDGDDVIIGGSGDDTITGGEGSDTINGGAGLDSIILTETTSVTDTIEISSVVGTSEGSGRKAVAGNDNDTGEDIVTGFAVGTDVIKISAIEVVGFVHGTDTAIGTATGGVNDGTVGSFLTTVGLVELNQITNNNWDDAGDVAVTFTTPIGTFNESNFEAALQYDITGTAAANTITGGVLADTISGGAGDDTLTGGDGNDTLNGDAGKDVVKGGAGNDTIINGSGFNYNYAGGGGEDYYDGGDGIDTLITGMIGGSWYGDYIDEIDLASGSAGGKGSDFQRDVLLNIENVTYVGALDAEIIGDDKSNTLLSNTGNDFLNGGDGDDTLGSGTGDDTILGGLGNDWIDGGDGNDRLAFWDVNYTEGIQVDLFAGTTLDQFGSVDTLLNIENANGTDFDDSLLGDSSDNGLDGNAGDDLLRGYGGSDSLWGREGDDEIYGGDDRDFLIGFAGNDFIDGESGNDVLRYDLDAKYGGILGVEVNLAQQTAIDGFGDTDTVKNIYEVRGTQYDDTILGDAADNVLSGRAGDDTLDAGSGDDKLYGGDGDDWLAGEDGDDTLDGGGGDDRLYGGAGDDTLSGGLGSDTFIFDAGFGNDIITDFIHGLDELKFYGASGELLSSTNISETQNEDGDSVLTVSDGSSVTLSGVSVYSLPFSIVSEKSGDNVTVSFYLDPDQDPADAGVGSFNATVGFEPNSLTYVSSSFADVLTGVPNTTEVDSGTLGLGGFGLTPVTDLATALFSVTFDAKWNK